MYDMVVRGGTVVDGTGSEGRTADVAITDGRVVEVGRVGAGRREIDADGAVVAPGFVDIHTHYDGQATWESRLQPSCWHGVTTVVTGNCGVGFAPVAADARDRLVELMEGVEDIPGTALHEGLRWDWESFPEFLDALDAIPHDVDIAAQVPHAALRVYAMGDRASADEDATEAEIARMARLAREAVAAGAIGFSTSRTLNHKSMSGEVTPSYAAAQAELVAIAAAIGETGQGVLQVISDFGDLEAEFALLRAMARDSRRPLSLSVAQTNSAPRLYREVLARLAALRAEGLEVRAQVGARGIGMLFGLDHTLHPFMFNPVWTDELAALPSAARAARMALPEVRAAVLRAQTDERNPNPLRGGLVHRWDLMYELGAEPDYEPSPEDSLARRAAREGRTPEEIAYDVLVSDAGRGMLSLMSANYADGSLDAVREMLTHPVAVPGLSDGGAHVGTICDGSFPTTLLTHWVRDRDRDRLDLPFVVRAQAAETARAVGLDDRGVLAPGYRADLNVIDTERLRLLRPEIHQDLPAGGRRLVQRAEGYRHTVIAGEETYRDGEPTDALPGRVVRGRRPAPVG